MAGGNKKIHEHPNAGKNDFSKRPQDAGRKPDIKTILKQYFLDEHNIRLSKNQMQDMIMVLLCKTKTEIIELAKNDDLPFWISLIAKKAERDFSKGSIHILDVLFDRVYGKPKEEVTQTVIEGDIFKGIKLDVNTNDITSEDSST